MHGPKRTDRVEFYCVARPGHGAAEVERLVLYMGRWALCPSAHEGEHRWREIEPTDIGVLRQLRAPRFRLDGSYHMA